MPNMTVEMNAFDKQVAYLQEVAKIVQFLPPNYLKIAQEKLPGKSLNRIKNARAGQVKDYEVLNVLKIIAESERVRRRNHALEELVLTEKPFSIDLVVEKNLFSQNE